jgi:hypothetical protein
LLIAEDVVLVHLVLVAPVSAPVPVPVLILLVAVALQGVAHPLNFPRPVLGSDDHELLLLHLLIRRCDDLLDALEIFVVVVIVVACGNESAGECIG